MTIITYSPPTKGPNPCTQCLGRKGVNGTGLSWRHWDKLPRQSRAGVKLGIVHPATCPQCNGTGEEPEETTT